MIMKETEILFDQEGGAYFFTDQDEQFYLHEFIRDVLIQQTILLIRQSLIPAVWGSELMLLVRMFLMNFSQFKLPPKKIVRIFRL